MEKTRRYWIHRISHVAEISYPFIEQGYLSHGWSDFAVIQGFIDKTRGPAGWQYFESTIKQEYGELPVSRHQLWRFIHEMKAGDWVVVPSWESFSIFEVLDDDPITIADIEGEIKDWNGKAYERDDKGFLVNDKKEIIDLGFARRVRCVAKDVSRSKFADSRLISRLKVRQTNVNIDDLGECVNDAIRRFQENAPIDFRHELDSMIPEIRSHIDTKLDPVRFEKLVRWYFLRQGATSVEIPSKNPPGKRGDEDVDVVAVFEQLHLIFYVQVKHHQGETDEWAAKQIALVKDLNNERADDGYSRVYWALTSAENFSPACQQKAQEAGIRLVDGIQFASMLIDAGFLGVNDAF